MSKDKNPEGGRVNGCVCTIRVYVSICRYMGIPQPQNACGDGGGDGGGVCLSADAGEGEVCACLCIYSSIHLSTGISMYVLCVCTKLGGGVRYRLEQRREQRAATVVAACV